MKFFEVVWIYDNLIEPPHPKMIACVSPEDGLFLRINSRNRFKPCVPLIKEPHHAFLDHDSYLECNILEFDDFIIDTAVDRAGIIGSVHPSLKSEVLAHILGLPYISAKDKAKLSKVFAG